MFGVLFGILSGVSFGLNSAATRRGVLESSAWAGVFISILAGIPLFLLAAALTGQLFDGDRLSRTAYLLLIAAGLIHFPIGRYCGFRSVKAMGANLAGPVQEVSILVTLAGGLAWLGERVTPLNAVGIAFIIIGPAIMLYRPRLRGRDAALDPLAVDPPGASVGLIDGVGAMAPTRGPAAGVANPAAPVVTFRLAEGYFFALLAAAAWGTTPLVIRSALSGTGLGILGGLVSYSAAAVLLILSMALPSNRITLLALDKTSTRWFLWGAVTIFLAQVFRFLALSLTSAIVAVSLIRTSIVFRLFFAFALNRRFENFEPPVIAGIVLSGLGSLLLVL